MKPLSIADYLDHLGPAQSRRRRRDARTRHFALEACRASQSGEPRPPPAFSALKRRRRRSASREETPRPTPWDRKPSGVESTARQLQPREKAAKPETSPCRLAEAHARGREEGLAEGQAEARTGAPPNSPPGSRRRWPSGASSSSTNTRELEARDPFRTSTRSRTTSAPPSLASSRRSWPKQVVKQATDELCKEIARLCAGGSPGLITIRGPERVLPSARTDRRPAGRVDSSRTKAPRRWSRPMSRKSRPSFAPGPTCSPRSTPERRR